jgi:hypothetical protein
MVDRDESIVKILTQEKEERERIVEQNKSKEVLATECLTSVNASLARARQLHSILVDSLRNIEFIDRGLGEMTPASHTTLDADHYLPSLTNRMLVSRISNAYHGVYLMEIEGAVEKAASTKTRHHQEIREAMSLISMARDDITRIDSQITECNATIVAEKFRLKAIWSVPDEVWGLIFQHSTGTTNASVDLNDDWIRSNRSWHGAFVISVVCQQWRSIAKAVPRLWANIRCIEEFGTLVTLLWSTATLKWQAILLGPYCWEELPRSMKA